MKKIHTISERILFKNGNIFDAEKSTCSKGSVLVEDGIIKDVGNIKVSAETRMIKCEGLTISVGFTDIHAHFREPGREDKENLETGSFAAMAGGFTRVCVMPNTNPVLDSPESIRYIIEKSEDLPVNIHPIGAITAGQKGVELAEIGEMVKAGICAISDDGIPLKNGNLIRYALEYSRIFDIPLINHAEDPDVRCDGQMNEGELSTRLGLPGNPGMAESVMVYRDLSIAEYTDSRIHIPHVSTAETVALIKKFKDKGVNVTAEVTPHHLGLTEEVLREFDTNAKVAPPLRSEKDREALIKGLIDGTIDCIATDHAPHTIEDKETDFFAAPFGMIGLESAFGMSHTVLTKAGAKTEDVIRWLTIAPERILNLPCFSIEKGRKANLTIIDKDEIWEFDQNDIFSRSSNSPMIGMEFIGKVKLTMSGSTIISDTSLFSD